DWACQRFARGLGRVRDGRRLIRVDRGQEVLVRDLELELVAVDLALVVRGSDREGVERLVRNLQGGHERDRNTAAQPRRTRRTRLDQTARMPSRTPRTGTGAASGRDPSIRAATLSANCFVSSAAT